MSAVTTQLICEELLVNMNIYYRHVQVSYVAEESLIVATNVFGWLSYEITVEQPIEGKEEFFIKIKDFNPDVVFDKNKLINKSFKVEELTEEYIEDFVKKKLTFLNP